MKEREYIENLYEVYKELLTDRERDYFENYYFEDYNLQEIADNNEVSKSYVGKFINAIEEKLIHYEEVLKLYEKTSKIRNIVKYIDDIETRIKIEEILDK
ncbi:MAG: sigma factor-like helix-turn-helix DNA-binding protein [bacterium]|nr:sigma factor-like helix-turn-helix DNA-binding protein [bacterium]